MKKHHKRRDWRTTRVAISKYRGRHDWYLRDTWSAKLPTWGNRNPRIAYYITL